MIAGHVDEEDLLVDESAPVVHSLEVEACLYGDDVEGVVEVFFQLVAVGLQPFEEVVSGVESEHSVFGIGGSHLFAEHVTVLVVEVL